MKRWILFIVVLAACSAPAASTSTATTTAATTSDVPTTSPASLSLVPPPRGYLAMSSLSEDLGVMVFGGFETPPAPDGDGSPLTDTWIYNTDWAEVGKEPPAATGDTITFDSGSGQVILYTIAARDWSDVNEVWSYDIDNDHWRKMSDEHIPRGMFGPRLVYDSESDVVLLIGPRGPSLETWAYDVSADSWAKMEPQVSPPGRDFAAFTYDSGSDRVLLFGGFPPLSDETMADTWAYDYNSNTWTDLTSEVSPAARGYTALAYDPITDKTYLFGGLPYPDSLNDTWSFDAKSSSWTELFPTSAPPPRGTHGMAYNPVDHSIVMFGGGVRVGGGPDWEALPAETWIYDPGSNTWNETP